MSDFSIARADPELIRRCLPFGECPRCHRAENIWYHTGEKWQGESLICIGCNALTLYQFEIPHTNLATGLQRMPLN